MTQQRKILLCVTGGGTSVIVPMFKARGVQVFDNNDVNREVIKGHMQSRGIVTTQDDAGRIIAILNPIDRISNKMLKNYRYMLFVERRMDIANSPTLIQLFNIKDYYINSQIDVEKQVDVLVNQLLK